MRQRHEGGARATYAVQGLVSPRFSAVAAIAKRNTGWTALWAISHVQKSGVAPLFISVESGNEKRPPGGRRAF
ncbi:hypothetical protein ABIA23_002785 [Sinorhizobium fredii]